MSKSKKNAAPTLRSLTDEIVSQEVVLREGGGAAGQERQRRHGRLPVRERLAKLLDDPNQFLEMGIWAAYKMYPAAGEVPAAGVVCGIGPIHGRPCMVIANDATVKAGAFFPATVKKVLRAQRIAFENELPIIYLVDSAGVDVRRQGEVVADEQDLRH